MTQFYVFCIHTLILFRLERYITHFRIYLFVQYTKFTLT